MLKLLSANSIVAINWFLLSPFSIIGFFCPIFSSIFIGTEYSDGTMRNRIISGHRRKNIYLANFITVCLANVMITLISSMMIIAFAGFFTLVAMAIHNKTISTVISMITFLVSYIIMGIVRRLVFSFYNEESISDVFSNLSNEMISQPVIEFLYDFSLWDSTCRL